jgi:hypothetical protein
MSEAKKEKPAPKGKEPKEGKKKKGGGPSALMIIIFMALTFVALPISIVAIPGMIPTLVMALTDRREGKFKTAAVGSLNLAGVAYVVFLVLLRKGFNVEYALQLIRSPEMWAVMWGAAAIGYGIFVVIPPIVAQFLATIAEIRARKLRGNLDELRQVWGEDVKGE